MRVVGANPWVVGRTCLRLACALAAYACVLAPAASGDPGDVDPGFAYEGHDVDRNLPPGEAISARGDGGFVVAGPGGDSRKLAGRMIVSRYTEAGRLDPTFSHDGSASLRVIPRTAASYLEISQVQELSTGEVTVVGQVISGGSRKFVAVRFRSDGARDLSFGGGDGMRELRGSVQDIAFDAEGRLLSLTETALRRELPSGAIDASFAGGGTTEIPDGFVATSLSIAGDGSAVVFDETGPFRAVRFQADGKLDPAFGDGGVAAPDIGTEFPPRIDDVVFSPEGSLYFLAYISAYPFFYSLVFHLNTDGSPDATFGEGDGAESLGGFPQNLALDEAGRILVLEGTDRNFAIEVLALLPDGSTDTAYGYKGLARVYFGLRDAVAADLAVTSDGKVVLTGGINARRGREDSRGLAQLLTEGGGDDDDGDGLPNRRDACRLVGAEGHRGCPVDRRRLSIGRAIGHSLSGRIFATTAECAVDSSVYLYLELPGSDQRLRRVNGRGFRPLSTWRVPLPHGRYYVGGPGGVADGRAACSAARSRSVSIP